MIEEEKLAERNKSGVFWVLLAVLGEAEAE